MTVILQNYSKGQVTNRTQFNIQDDAFPNLINAYQWRGRIKRKRGTSLVCRLNKQIGITDGSGDATITIKPHPIEEGLAYFIVGSNVFTDPRGSSPVTLLTNGPGTATLNRTTGVLTISGSNHTTAIFYYPNLPVMGIEQLVNNLPVNGATLLFDTKYAYNMGNNYPYTVSDVSLYKNPTASGPYSYTSYVAKSTQTSLWWNGQDYQQFYTTNYEGALWNTNGITIPYDFTNIGMQFKPITTVTVTSTTEATLAITAHGLVKGDFVFINEVSTTTGINFQTGYVISNDPQNPNQVDIKFPYANIATNGTGGIAQYLTNRSDITKDGITWYDGDPTSSSLGWVNFAPPLSQDNFSIGGQIARKYYLVGARIIFPFKDRILFLGPVIQASTGDPVYLQDTIIYSQNGTPYYTASFTGDVDLPTTTFNPILTPLNVETNTVQTATANSYFCDSTGFGGFLTIGLDQPILTCSNNEDVLIIGFQDKQTRLIYTGNDIVPFNFYVINSELGSGATFSAVNLDKGVLSLGGHGITMTSQTGAQRIDLEIPDTIFQFNLNGNGFERVCAQRDFINEWIYFTYCNNQNLLPDPTLPVFPNQTLQYNYREDTWAIFTETYTTYGSFRPSTSTSFTWATVGTVFPTWSVWNEPWNSGSTTILQPKVLAGNQQGFVFARDEGTAEATSLQIQNIVGSTVTCTNHNLLSTLPIYITISGALGTVSDLVNDKVFSISVVDENTFTLSPTITTGTYLGGGLITRYYVPIIQTKQFPTNWQTMRQTRIGVQQYLFTTTASGQVTVNLYLNNDGNVSAAWNSLINNPEPNGLIYSQIVYTCPESTNLGLSPANVTLQQQLPQDGPQQTWHRVNTSLIGYTIQIGVTLSDEQMRDANRILQTAEIELHSMIFNLTPSMLLS